MLSFQVLNSTPAKPNSCHPMCLKSGLSCFYPSLQRITLLVPVLFLACLILLEYKLPMIKTFALFISLCLTSRKYDRHSMNMCWTDVKLNDLSTRSYPNSSVWTKLSCLHGSSSHCNSYYNCPHSAIVSAFRKLRFWSANALGMRFYLPTSILPGIDSQLLWIIFKSPVEL